MSFRAHPSRASWPLALVLGLLLCAPSTIAQTRRRPADGPPVRLVLLIAADQFRADYLTRFGSLNGGFRTLMTRGAMFTDAHLEHATTVTAVGHATMLSGATPAVSGIIDNTWYERASKRAVESITDLESPIVGADGDGGIGASPRRLLVSTLGDQLKLAAPGPVLPKVIGLSLKDRSAILPAGHAADGVYFFRGGRFVTSAYYAKALPAWVEAVNAKRLPDTYAGKRWEFEGGSHDYPAQPSAKLNAAVTTSPAGNELVLAMARAALEHEQLGQRGVTDVLTVSFSSNDSVGHTYGPESPEVRDITRQTDRQVQQLLDEVDRRVGLSHVLVAFTTDHGVVTVPEVATALKLPGGRFKAQALYDAVRGALDARFGAQAWIERGSLPHVYLDHAVLAEQKVDPAEARRVAAEAAARLPHVARVYTRDAILAGQVPQDLISARVTRGYHRDRSGDLYVVLDPLWTTAAAGTSHGTPYSYDAHIPLILMGPGVVPGVYHQRAAMNDLAPTLAALLGVEPPTGSEGRVLHEALRGVSGATGAGAVDTTGRGSRTSPAAQKAAP
jgi:predicted AlkP superfamily pyrophosphatase or phosphodiesterase